MLSTIINVENEEYTIKYNMVNEIMSIYNKLKNNKILTLKEIDSYSLIYKNIIGKINYEKNNTDEIQEAIKNNYKETKDSLTKKLNSFIKKEKNNKRKVFIKEL